MKSKKKGNNVRYSKAIILFSLLLFALMIGRVTQLALSKKIDGIDLKELASKRTTRTQTLSAKRGNIYSKDGEVLAQNVSAYKLIAYLDPKRTANKKKPQHVVDKEKTAEALAPILNMEKDEVLKYLNKENVYQTEFGSKGKNLTELVKKQIEDLNYSFIEYMVYKLRRIGKKGNPYIEILEKQISKLGTNTDDIVKKEHLYIATLKIKIGVCITSLKAINRISFQKIFEKTNKTEELLNNDPSGIFPRQTEDTKELYRAKIKKISVKTKISEIYITEEILRLANRYKEAEDTEEKRKSHVGYYLIDEGIYELKEAILEKKVKRKSKKFLSRLYIYSIVVLPLLGDFEISELVGRTSISKIILFLILYIPLYTLILRIINYIISRIVKPLNIPKINYENGIDDECKTMVVIPTILDSKEKVEEMFKKIEIYFVS